MFNLGLMYEKRRGVSPEAPEADLLEATRECYEAAAEAGVTKAMVCMPPRCRAALRPCLSPTHASPPYVFLHAPMLPWRAYHPAIWSLSLPHHQNLPVTHLPNFAL